MKTKSSIFLVVLLILAAFGCSSTDVVEVTNFSPEGKVDNLTTFTIEFNKNLAPADVRYKWLTENFVEFEPKIEGKFKWIDGRTLIFSPDVPFQPIQEYKAKVTNKVLFDSQYSSEFEEYDFHTPYFEATKAEFFWKQISGEGYEPTVNANLYFNYPVQPDQLSQYLEITENDSPIKNYEIVIEESADVIALSLGEFQQTDEEQNINITVKKGLQSVIGKKALEEEREFEYELEPLTRLAIREVSSGFDGESGWIKVKTSQMVDEKVLDKYVSVKPGKNLQFYVTQNSFRIEGDFEDARTINLKIKKGLPGFYGGELEFAFEQMISLVDLKPSVNFADKREKYLLRGGQQNLAINTVNLNEIDIKVSQVFKNNLLHFLDRYSYLYNNNYRYNTYYRVDNFGKELYTKSIDLSSQQNWLQKSVLNVDDLLEQKRKGVYIISARSAEDRWVPVSKMIALSDIGLIAKMGEDEIMVFANSI